MTRRGIAAITVGAILLSTAGLAVAHWCSNIFVARARFVVKPEKTTVYVGNQPVQFRVYLQNNFPYKLFDVQMRGTASGYTFSASPSQQDIHPGQNVSYMFTVTRTTAAAGNLTTSAAIQMRFRLGSWRSTTDALVAQNPTQQTLINMSTYGGAGSQTGSINAGTLADLFAGATLSSSAPSFGRTGIGQLAHWFGYRYCYDSGGTYRCLSQDCPAPCAEGSSWQSVDQFPQHCMRAGVELGARKAKLGSDQTYARNAVANAITKGHANCTPNNSATNSSSGSYQQCAGEYRCLAAVVGGHIWRGASNTTTIENALNTLTGNLDVCRTYGLRALGKITTATSNCSNSMFYKEACCAAAEGLNNNDGPVKSILMAKAGDGDDVGSYNSLYYSYLLYLVQAYRKTSVGHVPFYPDAGVPTTDGAAPPPDLKPPADTKPWPDTKAPADTKPWPTPDTKPAADTKPWPTPDQGVKKDTKPWPTPDQSVADQSTDDSTQPGDVTLTDADAQQPLEDGPGIPNEGGATLPDTGGGHGQSRSLEGGCGCELGARASSTSLALVLLFGLVVVLRRRRLKK